MLSDMTTFLFYFILPLHLLPRPTIISQMSATIRPDFTISHCNKHCIPMGSLRVKVYGEYTVFHF